MLVKSLDANTISSPESTPCEVFIKLISEFWVCKTLKLLIEPLPPLMILMVRVVCVPDVIVTFLGLIDIIDNAAYNILYGLEV